MAIHTVTTSVKQMMQSKHGYIVHKYSKTEFETNAGPNKVALF